MIEGNVFTSCDFEDGFCGWTNRYWSRTEDQSPLVNTGPMRAYHGLYYIYSHGGKIGHNVTATLESNGIPPSKYCLLFNYHMQGLHIEELEVKLNDQTTAIWYRNVTEQGAEWKCAAINVTIGQPDSRIRFISRTGKTKNSLYDIIGLDNIKLVSGVCNSLDCDSSFNVTSTTTRQQPISSTTTDSVIEVQESTETESSWFIRNLPYLVGVPVAVFLVSFVVIGACIFHSHKESSRRLPAGIMRGPYRADGLNDRYRDDPTNHRDTGHDLYYSEPDTDTYDYVDVVRDPDSLYLDVIPDSSGADCVQNGSHPADVSPKPGDYYNDESPYCEPVKATQDK